MSTTAATAEMSLFVDMLAPDTALPSLKTASLTRSRQSMERRLMSMESDFRRDQDDMLYLRHGQGAQSSSGKRRFHDMADVYSMNGDRTAVESVDETDLDISTARPPTARGPPTRTSSRSTRSRMFSPLLSPPAEPIPLDERPSQQDVYDKAPPPGYKRLKKVRGPHKQVWANEYVESGKQQPQSSVYVDSSPGHVYSPRYPSNLGHQQPLFQQLPVQFLGDGFSGDETKTRKTRKRARTDNSNNSAGSSSRKRRKAADAASPILGSLDIVNLSQEERAVDMAAAAAIAYAAARAASKVNNITKMIPLRPAVEVPPGISWEFDDNPTSVIKKGRENDKMKEVTMVPSSCDESGRVFVIQDAEAVTSHPVLPPLREAKK